MRERSDTWHEMRRIHEGLSNMTGCKHDEINLVRTELMNFCTKCCATICLVTGAVRDRHGKVIANVTTPEWEPKPEPPPLQRAIALIEDELEAAKDADDGTEDLEKALSLLNMLRRKEEKPLDKVFERLNVLAKADEDKAAELMSLVHETVIANASDMAEFVMALPEGQVNSDISALVSLTRRADLHSRVAGAYRWAIHDIRCALGLAAGDTVEEISAVIKIHPTERK